MIGIAHAEMSETKAYMRNHPFKGGMGERDLRYHRSTKIAAAVEMIVAMSVVPTISAGFKEL